MLRQLKRLISPRHPLRLFWHHCKAVVAAVWYGFPARKLTLIGITGTDGKTTTVGMTAHILLKNGMRVGALSTAFFQISNSITWNATQKTSPSPFAIQKFLRRCLHEGCTHAVLEISSHGLDQGRVDWTWPKVAAITNLAEEHLDYHKTMEDYSNTKRKLFHKLRGSGTKVLNAEDRTFTAYSRVASNETIAYSTKNALPGPKSDSECGIWAEGTRCTVTGCDTTIRCNTQEGSWPLHLQIPGSFNVGNALCAIACAHAAGVALPKAVSELFDFKGIPGRMERIDAGQNFTVLVDFTVTPQSYEATLSTIKQSLEPGKRFLVLTGSCGDRMKEKRPLVGKLCSQYADVIVVANEDPYTEDPQKIIEEVWAGIDQSKTSAHKIFDRRGAIAFLLREAKQGDVVLLCGKGSDTTMMLKDGQIPWNEREIVRDLLKHLHG